MHEARAMIDNLLDKIHRIKEYVMPWIYAVLIVIVMVLILGTAV